MCARAAAAEKELADVQAVKDEMAIVDEKLARATSHKAKGPLQARRRELQVLISPTTPVARALHGFGITKSLMND
eukprot:COSAG05_NODE_8841_length_667_cov_0.945423_2_plen_75_part_00